jgi:hypothetical protein
LYKVHIRVYANRSIEVPATLYAANGTALHTFITRFGLFLIQNNKMTSNMRIDIRGYVSRLHGQNDANGNAINELSNSGSTPTGLSTFDLNSPEDDPKSFGPYPVNRAVQGLKGNAQIVISNIRSGILMHTGEWDNWNPRLPMPNSHGCIHGHPEDIKLVWQKLVALGVKVRPNPGGKLPYPYQPQVRFESLENFSKPTTTYHHIRSTHSISLFVFRESCRLNKSIKELLLHLFKNKPTTYHHIENGGKINLHFNHGVLQMHRSIYPSIEIDRQNLVFLVCFDRKDIDRFLVWFVFLCPDTNTSIPTSRPDGSVP